MIKQNQKKYNNYLKALFIVALVIFGLSILLIPKSAYAFELKPAYSVLKDNGDIKAIWNNMLKFVNALIIAILIFIAFANILRININSYGIKKFLPLLVMAVIAANFSYLFCRILVDLANVVSHLLIYGIGVDGNISNSQNLGVAGAFDFTSMPSISP